MPRAAIVDGVRTPFIKAGASFKRLSAVDLGCLVVKELLARAELDPARIREIIFGNVVQPMEAANVARVISLFSGIPFEVPALTIQRNCGSGVEAVIQAARMIWHEGAEVTLAGGTESMSNIPLVCSSEMKECFEKSIASKSWLKRFRAITQFRPEMLKPRNALLETLTDPYSEMIMGKTAEVLAREFRIRRDDQDGLAAESHRRAVRARSAGIFKEEIAPVYTAMEVIHEDTGPREDESVGKLSKTRPYFDRRYGTVTVGNSCSVADGAVALLLMSEDVARSEGREILGFVKSYAVAGLDPARMGLGPVYAIPQALDRAQLGLEQIDVIEINEAFAAQIIACKIALDSERFCSERLGRGRVGLLSPDKMNVNGGAIALGHPVGASGARLVLTALRELKRRGGKFALVSLCVGGGQGMAMVLERGN